MFNEMIPIRLKLADLRAVEVRLEMNNYGVSRVPLEPPGI
jgi:hypothetical protein